MVSEKNDLPRKQALKTPDDDGIQALAGKFEGLDCCNYRYYRQKDKSLRIYDRDGKLIMHMYGSLLDYSGSSFNGAHFDCVDDDDNKKYFGILTAFGAKRA